VRPKTARHKCAKLTGGIITYHSLSEALGQRADFGCPAPYTVGVYRRNFFTRLIFPLSGSSVHQRDTRGKHH